MSEIKTIKEIVKMQLAIEGIDYDAVVSAVRAGGHDIQDLEKKVRDAFDEVMLDRLYMKAARDGNVTLMQNLLGKTVWAKLKDDEDEKTLMRKIAEFGAAWVEGAKPHGPIPGDAKT